MLAEAVSTSPESYHAIGWVLATLGALGAALFGAQRFIRGSIGVSEQERTIGGQPIRVQSQPPYVTRDELDRTTTPITDRVARVEVLVTNAALEVSRLRVDMHAIETTINAAGEMRASKIHDRLDLVLEAVAELRGHVAASERRKD